MPEDNFSIKEWYKSIESFRALFVVIILFFIYFFLHSVPADFPKGEVLSVKQGQTLEMIADDMNESEIVRSSSVFRTHVILLGGERSVMAGDYLLDRREGPVSLARRLVRGDFHLEPVRITIPEGWNIFEIGEYLKEKLVKFDKESFLKLAKEKEGYLFPDTYFVTPTIKPEDIIDKMSNNFKNKLMKIPGVATTTYGLDDVVTMASILEREVRTMESRRTVAGILWKRIRLGMPLQVDASFDYINGKSSEELTVDDLKIDSPYNTYLYIGFPPTPIGNPGENSIIAAITPIKTSYLYFLTSKDGKIYYAKTFEEHKKNKELYLR